MDLCQYFGHKKLKVYSAFLILPPPSAVVSYSRWHYGFSYYVLKDCPPGFSEILICVEIDIFLFHYGMEGFYAGIIIGIPFTAE